MRRVFAILFGMISLSLSAADYSIENDYAKFVFGGTKNLVCRKITNKATGITIRTDDIKAAGNPLWHLVFLSTDNRIITVVPKTFPAVRKISSRHLRFSWSEKAESYVIHFTADIQLPEDSGIADWKFAAKVSGGTGVLIREVRFPRLNRIRSIGDDALLIPQLQGHIIRNPAHRTFERTNIYPGWWASQFFTFSGSKKMEYYRYNPAKPYHVIGTVRGDAEDETGLYFSSDDPTCSRKRMFLKGEQKNGWFSAGISHYPAVQKTGNPESSFTFSLPYSVKLGTYKGGVFAGMDLYRKEIATRSFLAEGPIYNQQKESYLSPWFRDYTLVWNAWSNPASATALSRFVTDYYQLPLVVHRYAYWGNNFDYNYPDYLPLRNNVREEWNLLRAAGVPEMPYVNIQRADIRSRSFFKQGLDKAVVMTHAGTPGPAHMQGNPSVSMHAGHPAWKNWLQHLILNFVGDSGAGGMYWDEGSQGGPPRSYNPYGSELDNGRLLAGNMRGMMGDLRKAMLSLDSKAFFSTEGFAEFLVGKIDSFLLYSWSLPGQNNDLGGKAMDNFPVFSYLWHDYSTAHSFTVRPGDTPETQRLGLGTGFVYGLYMQPYIRMTPGAQYEYSRNLAHAGYRAGYRYLIGGRMLPMAVVDKPELVGLASAALVSPSYDVPWRNIPWHGSKVAGSAWLDHPNKTIGFTLANLTDKPQSAKLYLKPDFYKEVPGRTLYRSWPLPVVKLADLNEKNQEIALDVPASQAMVLEIRKDAPPQPRKLFATNGLLINSDEKGIFPAWKKSDGVFCGAQISAARNEIVSGKNTVTLYERDGSKARTQKPWTEYVFEQGLISPDEKLSFDRFYSLGVSFSGSAQTTLLSSGNSAYGTIKVSNAGALNYSGTQTVMIADKNGNITVKPSSLAVGEYRILILPENLKKIPESKMTATYLSLEDRNQINEYLHSENGKLFLKNGKKADFDISGKRLWLGEKLELPFTVKLLNSAHCKTVRVQTSDGRSILTAEDGDYGKYARFLATREINGVVYRQIISLDIAEPFMLDIPSSNRIITADSKSGEAVTVVRFLNYSDKKIPVSIAADLPEGWSLPESKNHFEFTIEPYAQCYLPVVIKTVPGITGSVDVTVKVSYGKENKVTQEHHVLCQMPEKVPVLRKDSKPLPQTKKQIGMNLRHINTFYIRPDSKGNVYCWTSFSNGKMELKDCQGKVVLQGKSENGRVVIEGKLPDGLYELKLNSGWFASFVANQANLIAVKTPYYRIDYSNQKYYFIPKKNAKRVRFAYTANHEPPFVVIKDPTGKQVDNIKLDFSHIIQYGSVWSFDIPEQYAGKLWSLEFRQPGTLFWLEGVSPRFNYIPGHITEKEAVSSILEVKQKFVNGNCHVLLGNGMTPLSAAGVGYTASMETVLKLDLPTPVTGKRKFIFNAALTNNWIENRYSLTIGFWVIGKNGEKEFRYFRQPMQNGTVFWQTYNGVRYALARNFIYQKLPETGNFQENSIDFETDKPVSSFVILINTGRLGVYTFKDFQIK